MNLLALSISVQFNVFSWYIEVLTNHEIRGGVNQTNYNKDQKSKSQEMLTVPSSLLSHVKSIDILSTPTVICHMSMICIPDDNEDK